MNRILGLDILRGIAAISVAVFHFTLGYGLDFGWQGNPPLVNFPFGAAGVRIFFVLSGFVIAMSLERGEGPLRFAQQRFARLYPAYIAGMIVTGFVIFGVGFNYRDIAVDDIPANLLMIANLLGHPYFDPSYWTLTREIAFYALVGIMFFILGGDRIPIFCIAWLAGSIVFNIFSGATGYFDVKTTADKLSIIFNCQFSYLFAGGMMLYKIRQGSRHPLVIFAFLLAIFAAGFSEYPTLQRIDVVNMVKAAFYTGIVMLFTWPGFSRLPAGFATFMGAISYPLYIIHQTAGFSIMRYLLDAGLNANLVVLITLTIVTLIAYAINVFVEKPVSRQIRSFGTARKVKAS